MRRKEKEKYRRSDRKHEKEKKRVGERERENKKEGEKEREKKRRKERKRERQLNIGLRFPSEIEKVQLLPFYKYAQDGRALIP